MTEEATAAPRPTLHDLAIAYAGALTQHEKAIEEKARADQAEVRMATQKRRAEQALGQALGLELQRHVEGQKRLAAGKVEFWQKVFDVNDAHRCVVVATYVRGDWFYQVTTREQRP